MKKTQAGTRHMPHVSPPNAPATALRASALSPAVYAIFTVSILLSAGLLFMVQPMFGKMALPLLGGASNVWNTAMVFFQGALLAGYLYAHGLSKLRNIKLQHTIHISVMAAAMLFLPLTIGAQWQNPPEGAPALWLLALMAASVGAPFFALSANAPLLQKWFSRTGHKHAEDPYFLYAASNLGSFVGLLGYPILIEPNLKLALQTDLWFSGYIVLTVLIGAGALLSWQIASNPVQAAAVPKTSALSWRQRLHWVWLSALPSALLLSVTSHITTDIVAVPFLWVVPLALYLLTFTIVFARRAIIPHRLSCALQPISVFFALLSMYVLGGISIMWLAGLAIFAFFVVTLVAHAELAKRRPDVAHLTEFYLFMSLGGVLGGSLIALGAPLVFDSIVEYPLLLVLSMLVRPWAPSRSRADIYIPLTLAVTIFAGEMLFDLRFTSTATWFVFFVALCVTIIKGGHSPLRLLFLMAVTVGLSHALKTGPNMEQTVHQSRSFFGVIRVTQQLGGQTHALVHGSTQHGMQFQDEARAQQPLLYYDRDAGLGQSFQALHAARDIKNVGIVGLGTGTVACYKQPGQNWTFFEIDPHVIKVARDDQYFSYLSRCAPDAAMEVGDARLTLRRTPEAHFDILAIDAFSSDSIPLHLMTKEALEMYVSRLAPGGLLLVHISNRHLQMEKPLAALAQALQLDAQVFNFDPPESDTALHYRTGSTWVAFSRDASTLEVITNFTKAHGQSDAWQPLTLEAPFPVWTDDYSNVFDILK